MVEAQHLVSTRRLVDSDEEQALLEELIDAVKPPVPTSAESLHYLLSTPFRYPPLPWGSRFGTRLERGLWYGSEDRATAFAEVAYYRFVFLGDTTAELGPLKLALSAFQARVETPHGVDLTAPPYDAHREIIASKTRYDETQALGRAMRAEGVVACRYPSARADGVNVVVFDPAAFRGTRPTTPEAWDAHVTRQVFEVSRRTFFRERRLRFRFERTRFEVDGRLPVPA